MQLGSPNVKQHLTFCNIPPSISIALEQYFLPICVLCGPSFLTECKLHENKSAVSHHSAPYLASMHGKNRHPIHIIKWTHRPCFPEIPSPRPSASRILQLLLGWPRVWGQWSIPEVLSDHLSDGNESLPVSSFRPQRSPPNPTFWNTHPLEYLGDHMKCLQNT